MNYVKIHFGVRPFADEDEPIVDGFDEADAVLDAVQADGGRAPPGWKPFAVGEDYYEDGRAPYDVVADAAAG